MNNFNVTVKQHKKNGAFNINNSTIDNKNNKTIYKIM